ncbi:MAG: GntR family transcriptional regulator [Firmicutes bacterium]|nr:GntR family transcriptional regulator [Bacillota bacterium]
MFHIGQKSRKSIYRQVVDNITGVLAPGSRLLSVRELSRQLLINPNTAAKAYRELEK